MKDKIRSIIREILNESNIVCMLEYESDRIRLSEIKMALEDEVWDDEEFYDESDLYQTEWLTKALNKREYVDYYELFVDACWEGMFSKEEYKGLTKKEAVNKLVNERFTNISKLLDLEIFEWNYVNNILNIKLKK